MLIASFAEVVSIGAIFPLISALMNPEKIYQYNELKQLFLFFQIKKANELLFPISLLFCIITLSSAIIRLTLMWAQYNLGASISIDFSIQIYKYSLYRPYSFHVSNNTSEIMSSINKANDLGSNLITPLLTLFSSSFVLAIVIIAIIAINPTIILITILGFALIYLLITLSTKKITTFEGERMSYESVRMLKSIQEGLGGIRDVLVDGTQEYFISIYRKSIVPFRKSWVKVNIIGSAPKFLVEAFGMILIAILATFIAFKQNNIQNAIPTIGVLAIGAQRMLPIMQLMFSSIISLRGNHANINDAMKMIEEIPNLQNSEEIQSIKFDKKIEIRNLYFRYNNEGSLILENLNLVINKGEKVGIIGSTGSGKSTILDLIMCLLKPTNGEILIDDSIIDDTNVRSWQKHIAHVPQSIYLADSSILQNIAFGITDNLIKRHLVINAAKKALISKKIEEFEDGYDTFVGERGVRLSGGQRQRIGIARALYKEADVIIFDEATSALDNLTEKEVMNSINQLGKNLTLIIVAHRLTTLQNCDKIFEFTKNGVKIHNSYQELINKM